ncbi:DgyrCDS6128 [Dimorphilus gyrociliatus]|uniref:DgyrCDS6128 n=1 Tax=Dimorphilus gyrociliatus TaxID=2664684 RepID=A0A7I8VM90_9ANNE|nr:DgyrCDS6128 [Dimorphilus gyrociliatus]
MDLYLMQKIISHPYESDSEVLVRRVDENNIRHTLQDMDKKGKRHFIAHLSKDMTFKLLQEALKVGMIDPDHHFVLANLDLYTIDLENFRYNYVNLTGFSLIDYDASYLEEVRRDVKKYEDKNNINIMKEGTIETQTALVYDAFQVLAKALSNADIGTIMNLSSLSCDKNDAWEYGGSLYNYLNSANVRDHY